MDREGKNIKEHSRKSLDHLNQTAGRYMDVSNSTNVEWEGKITKQVTEWTCLGPKKQAKMGSQRNRQGMCQTGGAAVQEFWLNFSLEEYRTCVTNFSDALR